MGNRKTPGHRGYVPGLSIAIRPKECVLVPMFAVPRAGHIEYGNGDDLRFSRGQLVIVAKFDL